jgi:hypothetical protein
MPTSLKNASAGVPKRTGRRRLSHSRMAASSRARSCHSSPAVVRAAKAGSIVKSKGTACGGMPKALSPYWGPGPRSPGVTIFWSMAVACRVSRRRMSVQTLCVERPARSMAARSGAGSPPSGSLNSRWHAAPIPSICAAIIRNWRVMRRMPPTSSVQVRPRGGRNPGRGRKPFPVDGRVVISGSSSAVTTSHSGRSGGGQQTMTSLTTDSDAGQSMTRYWAGIGRSDPESRPSRTSSSRYRWASRSSRRACASTNTWERSPAGATNTGCLEVCRSRRAVCDSCSPR